MTDTDLKLAPDDLKRPHIALAIGTGLIVRSDRCRSNTEAYVEPGALERMFEKVRRNGGDVKYVAMDEPYFYGIAISARPLVMNPRRLLPKPSRKASGSSENIS